MNFYFPSKPTRISIDSALFTQCSNDPNFVAQRKKDGWRIQLHKLDNEITLFTRHKRPLPPLIGDVDWSSIRKMLVNNIHCGSCIIDGEFMHRRSTLKETFYVWDIFELEGKRLMNSYHHRKETLSNIITPTATLQVLEDYSTDFISLWQSLDRSLDEGIVIKDLRESLNVNFCKTTKSPRQYKILLDDPRNQYGHLDRD